MIVKRSKGLFVLATSLSLALTLASCSSAKEEPEAAPAESTEQSAQGEQGVNEKLAVSGNEFTNSVEYLLMPKTHEGATTGWTSEVAGFDMNSSNLIVNSKVATYDMESDPEKLTIRILNPDNGDTLFKGEVEKIGEASDYRFFSTYTNGKHWVHYLQSGIKAGDSSSLEKDRPVIKLSSVQVTDNNESMPMGLEEDEISFSTSDQLEFSPSDSGSIQHIILNEDKEGSTYTVLGPKILKAKSGIKKGDKKSGVIEIVATSRNEALFTTYSKEDGLPIGTSTESGWKLNSLGVDKGSYVRWVDDGYLLMDDGSLVDLEKRKLVTKFDMDLENAEHSVSENRKFVAIGSVIYDVAADKLSSYEENDDRKGVSFTAIDNNGVAYGNVNDDSMETVVTVDSRTKKLEVSTGEELGKNTRIDGVSNDGTIIYINGGSSVIGVNKPQQDSSEASVESSPEESPAE